MASKRRNKKQQGETTNERAHSRFLRTLTLSPLPLSTPHLPLSIAHHLSFIWSAGIVKCERPTIVPPPRDLCCYWRARAHFNETEGIEKSVWGENARENDESEPFLETNFRCVLPATLYPWSRTIAQLNWAIKKWPAGYEQWETWVKRKKIAKTTITNQNIFLFGQKEISSYVYQQDFLVRRDNNQVTRKIRTSIKSSRQSKSGKTIE